MRRSREKRGRPASAQAQFDRTTRPCLTLRPPRAANPEPRSPSRGPARRNHREGCEKNPPNNRQNPPPLPVAVPPGNRKPPPKPRAPERRQGGGGPPPPGGGGPPLIRGRRRRSFKFREGVFSFFLIFPFPSGGGGEVYSRPGPRRGGGGPQGFFWGGKNFFGARGAPRGPRFFFPREFLVAGRRFGVFCRPPRRAVFLGPPPPPLSFHLPRPAAGPLPRPPLPPGVAQMAERRTVHPRGAGSSPAPGVQDTEGPPLRRAFE